MAASPSCSPGAEGSVDGGSVDGGSANDGDRADGDRPDRATGIDTHNAANPDAAVPDAVNPDVAIPDAGPTVKPPQKGSVRIAFNALPVLWLGGPEALWQGKWTPFFWAVPPTGWTIEVHVAHDGTWQPSAPPNLRWAVAGATTFQPITTAAIDTSGRGWRVEDGGHRWQALVRAMPAADAEKNLGTLQLSADVQGVVAPATTLQVRTLPAAIDPFDQVDHWLLTTSRDRSSVQISPKKGGGFQVGAPLPWQANGVPDLQDAMAALGLLGGGSVWRKTLMAKLQTDLQVQFRGFFHLDPKTGAIGVDSVRIQIAFEGDPGVPADPVAAGWSQMAIGGEDPGYNPVKTGSKFFFGQSTVDPWNKKPNTNTANNRGIYTTSFARFVLGNPLLVGLLSDVATATGGKPFGSQPSELAWLQPGFDPVKLPKGAKRDRAILFRTIWRFFTLALASVTTHEIGHSVGLVMMGLPPYGLLAGAQQGPGLLSAVSSYHIDTAGFNLMQPGGSFSVNDLMKGKAQFNAANLAWLRRRLVVLPKVAK